MLCRWFCAGAALLLAAGVARTSEKDAGPGRVAVGKVVSLELQDDGAGALTVLVKRPARVPLPPREATFQVTKETKFLTGGPGGEATPVAADRLADVFKKSTDVTVRYQGDGDQRTAVTVSTAGVAPEDAKPPAKDEGTLKRLLQAKVEAAQKLYDLRAAQYGAGTADFAGVAAAGRQVIAAELRLLDKKEDRVAACEENLEHCTDVKKMAEAREKEGAAAPGDALQAECERLDAEILLEEEKAK